MSKIIAIDTDLVLDIPLFNLGEEFAAGKVKDSSQRNNDGSVTVARPGPDIGGWYFDGAAGTHIVNTSAGFAGLTSKGSLELWLNQIDGDDNAYRGYINARLAAQGTWIYKNNVNEFIVGSQGAGGTTNSTAGGAWDWEATKGQWHHFLFTWNQATTTHAGYVDGVRLINNTAVTATHFPTTAPTGYCVMGISPSGHNGNGNVARARVWKRPLTMSEILSCYAEFLEKMAVVK